jgi:hypothetical protein
LERAIFAKPRQSGRVQRKSAGLLVDDESFKVVGLPFYNKEKENEFAASFSAKL